MQYDFQLDTRPNSQHPLLRKVRLQVPAEEVQRVFDQTVREFQRVGQVPGFREGKAPVSLVKRHFLQEIQHQVYHQVQKEVVDQVFQDQKWSIAGEIHVEEDSQHRRGEGEHAHGLNEGDAFSVTAWFEEVPSVTVRDYQGISLKRPVLKEGEEEQGVLFEKLLRDQIAAFLIQSHSDFAIPLSWVKREWERLFLIAVELWKRNYQDSFKGDFNQVLSQISSEVEGEAQRNVRLAVLLDQIAKQEGLQVPTEEVISRWKSEEPSNLTQERFQVLHRECLREKTIQFLRDRAVLGDSSDSI